MESRRFLAFSPSGFHHVAYTQWGDPDNPRVVFCVHGLTRNGRDFDFLAGALERDYRVICPDVIGRGKSDWLTNKADYGYPLYVSQMAALIAHIGVEEIHWVGTSMGGLIGMFLAGLPGTPIRRLVMNDIGPFLPKASLERLAQYVGKDPAFDTFEQLEAHVRIISAPFGPLTDAQWRHLATHCSYVDSAGKYRFAYDPAIGEPFKAEQQDINLEPMWNAVRCPVLVIRGKESDLLLPETLEKMKSRPNTEAVEIEGTGHAPMFMNSDQIEIVRSFLNRN
ncbi:MAG TPA: alpha/beta hydrolase [Burkholderiales bacterium]|nr:alpha/beta hydrolase [Burkholderiales bacterium]